MLRLPGDRSDPGLLALLGLRRDPADRSRALSAPGGSRPRTGRCLATRPLLEGAAQLEGWLLGDPSLVTELDPIPPEGLPRRRAEDLLDALRAEIERRRV